MASGLLLAVSAAAQGADRLRRPARFWAAAWPRCCSELREPDLDFIFSSELVPDTLRVSSEPAPGSRLLIAREILAQHGLTLRAVRPGIFAVVRDPRGMRPRPSIAAPEGAACRIRRAPRRSPRVVVSTSRYSLDGSACIGRRAGARATSSRCSRCSARTPSVRSVACPASRRTGSPRSPTSAAAKRAKC